MILLANLSIDFPMLGTSELVANANSPFGSLVAPAAIALMIALAVVAVGLSIRRDVD